MLFCDIRGFSRISRKHGPTITLKWTNDVLSTLSDCVQKHAGRAGRLHRRRIDGDVGAPEAQPDHPERACLAAPRDDRVDAGLERTMAGTSRRADGVGIGINTGIARVGNTGSQRKFKYGPLGDTVNVASRVQGASKYFRSNLLITQGLPRSAGPRIPASQAGQGPSRQHLRSDRAVRALPGWRARRPSTRNRI